MSTTPACYHTGCTDPVEVESFLPGGWVPECKAHGKQTLKQNWVADCFKQRKYGDTHGWY